jgi:orotate phosphoribosyltransferase
VSTTTRAPDDALAVRLVTAPGVVRAGAGCWDRGRTPIHPLTLEYAYADPALLRDLGVSGARSARRFGVEVVVGAETGGVPLAAAVSLASDVPFAFVRKPGYRGHEVDEPPVRGADVRGRQVLLVDDAVSSGASLERFADELADEGAHLAGAFVLVAERQRHRQPLGRGRPAVGGPDRGGLTLRRIEREPAMAETRNR